MKSNVEINIYIGNIKKFNNYITDLKNDYKTLTELAVIHDMSLKSGQFQYNHVDNVVMFADEYGSVTESLLDNFRFLINIFDVKKVYLQNPPERIRKSLKRIIPENNYIIIKEEEPKVDERLIKEFYERASDKIIGQEKAIRIISQNILKSLKFNDKNKPIILLFYGPSGVGKTETSKILNNVLNKGAEENLFIKPFGMFQNPENINTLYGGKLSDPSFAKELLDRDSNVILIDEFDKASPICFPAFYQLFDEGIFIDRNYKVELKNSIIICTSNFDSIDEIKRVLGDPIFYRFDGLIPFEKLSEATKLKIFEKKYYEYYEELSEDEKTIIDRKNIKGILEKAIKNYDNARSIEGIIKDTLSLELLAKKYLTQEPQI